VFDLGNQYYKQYYLIRVFFNISDIKIKVHLTLEQAMQAQRGDTFSYTLSLTSALDGVG
jgi:hypothetical protein